jgi:hypothetical protein
MTLALLLALLMPGTATPPVALNGTEMELAGRAETAFQDGVKLRALGAHARAEFQAAAACYEELRRRGVENARLEQDLGNAYFLADDLPHAILCFRRGLRLAPLDPALRRCLAEARGQVIYPDNTAFGRPPVVQGRLVLPGWLNNGIFAGGVLLYGLACAAVTRWLMVRRLRWLLGGWVMLFGAGLLTFLLGQVAHGVGVEDAHPLVVIAEDGVLLRKGDGLAFPPRYDTVVNRGVEARQLFERDGWVQIELAAGEVGWVPREYVLTDGL